MLHNVLLRTLTLLLTLVFGLCARVPGCELQGACVGHYKEGELLAVTQTREEAERLAAQYEITLIDWSDGLAKFRTDGDAVEVIKRGEQNGWTPLSLNSRDKLH